MRFLTRLSLLGVSSIEDCEQQISELEGMLDSQVIFISFTFWKILFLPYKFCIDHEHIILFQSWCQNIFRLTLQIYTIENRKELEEFIPSAKEIYKFYNPTASCNLNLKAKLEASWSKVKIPIPIHIFTCKAQ